MRKNVEKIQLMLIATTKNTPICVYARTLDGSISTPANPVVIAVKNSED
jgi:hypothetical protein